MHPILKTNTSRHKNIDRLQHNNSGRLQHHFLAKRQVIQAKKKKKEISKETSELKNSKDQTNLTDICKIFHPTASQYTVFSKAHGILSKINHILVQRQVLANTRKLR
jgi:hypothetical protein